MFAFRSCRLACKSPVGHLRSPVQLWAYNFGPYIRNFRTQSAKLNIPKSTDSGSSRDLQSNDIKSRIPKFPFHKDTVPTLIPPANSPRVSSNFTFSQLMNILFTKKEPEILYVAESHRLYFLTCFALVAIVTYNMYDLLERSFISIKKMHVENEEGLPVAHQYMKSAGRTGLALALASIYLVAGLAFAILPTRLVRRIEYLPGSKAPKKSEAMISLLTHPWWPGKPSPVVTVPVADLSIGRRTKVWTGEGFYGTAQRSQFFFLIFEKGKWLPWIVDRSGWFWGDGRVYDVLLGKEPVAEAELGLSYDDMLKLRQADIDRRKAELRKELGPAWQLKSIAKLMENDAKIVGSSVSKSIAGAIKEQNDKKRLK